MRQARQLKKMAEARLSFEERKTITILIQFFLSKNVYIFWHTLINEQSLCNVCKLVVFLHAILLRVCMSLSSIACYMPYPFQKLFYCTQCTAMDYLKLFNVQKAKTTYAYKNVREKLRRTSAAIWF
jgi:flagellar biosynthesis protein FliQ